jgi:small subunit ribosomal protein S18
LTPTNPEILGKFTSETGKILPRRVTGVSAKLHRHINNAIKQSRAINLMP